MVGMNKDGTPKYTRHSNRDLANNPEVTTWKRKNPKKLRFFYIDGKLHKIVHINRSLDIATAYSYPDKDYRQYPWVWLKKNHKKAYGMQDVANFVQRDRRWIQRCMLDGKIRKPQKAVSLINETRYTYYFSEDDILEIQDYFAHQHIGYPRKDGLITPQATPSRTDLRAMMNADTMFYVQGPDGGFKPVWREIEDI
jgi:hypothetical protein